MHTYRTDAHLFKVQLLLWSYLFIYLIRPYTYLNICIGALVRLGTRTYKLICRIQLYIDQERRIPNVNGGSPRCESKYNMHISHIIAYIYITCAFPTSLRIYVSFFISLHRRSHYIIRICIHCSSFLYDTHY